MSVRIARRWLGRTLLATAAMACSAGSLLACPGCIEGSSPSVQTGFLWSSILLMVTPYLVVGIIGGGLFLAYRRSIRQQVERFLRHEARSADRPDPQPRETAR